MTTSNTKVGHEFVEFIPDKLEPSTIYISLKYKTMAHLCLCGCGNKVVTHLSPTGWNVKFDGRTISVHPSVGNWNLPCQSHYWISGSTVKWAERWSKRRIDAGFARDQRIKHEFYGEVPTEPKKRQAFAQDRSAGEDNTSRASWWERVKRKF